jgi:hypothetical protein
MQGIEKIRSVLEDRGFQYVPGEKGGSSSGPFAIGFFRRTVGFLRRDVLEIGLIVRFGNQLGCPNYSDGRGYAGHEDLVWAIDAAAQARLVAGEFLSCRSKLGGDPFDALKADLVEIVLPALDASEAKFRKALRRAVHKGQTGMGSHYASSA